MSKRKKRKAQGERERLAAFAELAAEFDRQLAVLNTPEGEERLTAMEKADLRVLPLGKAGPSF